MGIAWGYTVEEPPPHPPPRDQLSWVQFCLSMWPCGSVTFRLCANVQVKCPYTEALLCPQVPCPTVLMPGACQAGRCTIVTPATHPPPHTHTQLTGAMPTETVPRGQLCRSYHKVNIIYWVVSFGKGVIYTVQLAL